VARIVNAGLPLISLDLPVAPQTWDTIGQVDMFLRSIKPLLILIPVGLIVVALATFVLGTFRVRRGRARAQAFRTSLLDALLGASILSVLVLTLPPSLAASHTLELVPFHKGWHDGNVRSQMLANIVLFIPLGVFGPARWPRLATWGRVLLAAAAFSAAIETLQFALDLGRQASVTDVILNTVGAAVGYLILRVGGRITSLSESSSSRAGEEETFRNLGEGSPARWGAES
jgi:VanZ family protein